MTRVEDQQGRMATIVTSKSKRFSVYCKTRLASVELTLGVDGVIHVYKLIHGRRSSVHLVAIGKGTNVFS